MAEQTVMNDYSSMTDEGIIAQIKLGDNNALNYINGQIFRIS